MRYSFTFTEVVLLFRVFLGVIRRCIGQSEGPGRLLLPSLQWGPLWTAGNPWAPNTT